MKDIAAHRHGFRSAADIKAFEQTPFSERDFPESTYEALKHGVEINPDGPALSFFVSANTFRTPKTLTHKELFAKVTQTANALRKLGIGRDGIANLFSSVCELLEFCRPGGHLGGISLPKVEGVRAGVTVGFGGETIAAGPEDDVYLVMVGQKPLRLAGRFEPAHQLFTLSGWPM